MNYINQRCQNCKKSLKTVLEKEVECTTSYGHYFRDFGTNFRTVDTYEKFGLKNPAAVALGTKGGKAKSEAKIKAAQINGKKGGRPKLITP